MKKYRKKPVIIEAVQWTGKNYLEISDFVLVGYHFINDKVILQTLEGDMIASPGDYIIKGINKEVYPCNPYIFEKTYEPVKDAERKNKGANLSPECDFYGKGCFNCDKKSECKKESEDWE